MNTHRIHKPGRLAGFAAIGIIAAGSLGMAACGSAETRAAAQPTNTTKAPEVIKPADSSRDGEFDPAAHIAPEHRKCFSDAMKHDGGDKALFACVDTADMVAVQRAYLAQETEATAAQIDCVVERMQSMPLDELRSAQSELGETFYIPCGLPS